MYDEANDIAWPALYLLDSEGSVHWRSLAETYPVRPAWQVVLEAFDALEASGRFGAHTP